MKVLILNGPPGIGKDTLANMLCEVAPIIRGEFKHFLYVEAAQWIQDHVKGAENITTAIVKARNENRDLKELPWFLELSVRRILQIVSEDVVKPAMGKDYFGRVAAEYWYGKHIHHVISDGGFSEEVNAVCDKFGAENVTVIRLKAPGFTFETDSRKYLMQDEVACRVITLEVIRGKPESTVKYLKDILLNTRG